MATRSGGTTRLFVAALLTGLVAFGCTTTDPPAIDPREDSPRQRAMVDSIAAALAGPMKARTPEEALLVDLESLYAPLDAEQRAFMEAIRRLPGADPSREPAEGIEWVRVEGQVVVTAEGERSMSLQLLPPDIWRAYHEMNESMKSDVGRGLVIGSGYRTPAHQLFIFVSYMPYYEYSWEKTRPHVSLPGASDHNRPERQGIDFVSETGVDLRYGDAAGFEALDEYRWLRANAERFGFVGGELGGPSPWHWHHEAGEDR
jgi:hypothetical protein